jgi:hypothetical protein
MPKRTRAEFSSLYAEIESHGTELSNLCDKVPELDMDGPLASDLEGMQRQLLLVARDATNAACQLYSHIRVARTK